MREWKQYTILIISVFIISAFLYRLICFHQYQEKIKNDVSQQVESKEKTDTPEPPKTNIKNIYEKLNKNILNYPFQNDESSMIQEKVSQHANNVRGKFEEISYNGNSFPAELVTLMEQELYTLKENHKVENFEQILIEKVGCDQFRLDLEDMYQLFPELEDNKDKITTVYDAYNIITSSSTRCTGIYHININPDDDHYVFVFWGGGTKGVHIVCLTKRIGNDFIKINEFQTQNGDGTVIQYNKDFYYVCLQRNDNLKCVDGFKIHKLDVNASNENILIRYLPERYIWENIINRMEIEYADELDNYINRIKKEITSDKYLENGMQTDIDIYIGDEIKDTTFDNKETMEIGNHNNNYMIDFTNSGIPVYIQKSNFIPSNGLCWHIRAKFYICDSCNQSFLELENMELGDSYFPTNIELVQIWFKKIANKVFTFRIYHISDYNYMLDVSLIEGDKVIQIRNDIFSPQYKFILKENAIFNKG